MLPISLPASFFKVLPLPHPCITHVPGINTFFFRLVKPGASGRFGDLVLCRVVAALEAGKDPAWAVTLETPDV